MRNNLRKKRPRDLSAIRVAERSPSPEMGRRVEQVLEKLEGSEDLHLGGERWPFWSKIGTIEARQFVTSLAQGAAESRLTRDAKGALQRLTEAGPPR